MIKRWERIDTRHPWDGRPIEVLRVDGRHFFHWRALRSARYYNRMVRQPRTTDPAGRGSRATFRYMVRDRRTGQLESVTEEMSA